MSVTVVLFSQIRESETEINLNGRMQIYCGRIKPKTSSIMWVIYGSEFVSKKYVPNNRSCTYSTQHTRLKPNSWITDSFSSFVTVSL